MLSLSRKTDYALVALAFLGGPGAGAGPVSSRQVAEATGLPEPVTQTVLKALAVARIVGSTRGAAGGYELAKPAEQVTVLEVVVAIEGPVQTTACCDGNLPILGQDCRLAGECSISPAIQAMHRRLMGVLERTTLADLLPREDELTELDVSKNMDPQLS
ncbi:MAG: RrF2 family transcriptional regulator [Phycisphaerales bacterium JB063]